MSFHLPELNIECDIYTGPWLSKVLRVTNEPCNLAYGRRSSLNDELSGTQNGGSMAMSLLLDAGTDVRDLSCSAVQDVVEVPAGSGRWYQVYNVDDIGRGFPNEHRCAVIFKISEAMFGSSYSGLSWPTPIP